MWYSGTDQCEGFDFFISYEFISQLTILEWIQVGLY